MYGDCNIIQKLLIPQNDYFINFRKDRLINDRKCFKDELEIQKHIEFIEQEIKLSKKNERMLELKNWLNHLVKAA